MHQDTLPARIPSQRPGDGHGNKQQHEQGDGVCLDKRRQTHDHLCQQRQGSIKRFVDGRELRQDQGDHGQNDQNGQRQDDRRIAQRLLHFCRELLLGLLLLSELAAARFQLSR